MTPSPPPTDAGCIRAPLTPTPLPGCGEPALRHTRTLRNATDNANDPTLFICSNPPTAKPPVTLARTDGQRRARRAVLGEAGGFHRGAFQARCGGQGPWRGGG